MPLADRIDEMECRERCDTLILSGNEVSASCDREIVVDVTREMLKKKLKCNVNAEELLDAHRIGKKPVSQKPDRRNILVRFRHRELRDDILKAARSVKPVGLYVNENLTPLKSTMLYTLRRAKKLHPGKIDGCGSYNGRVFVWLRSSEPSQRNKKVVVSNIAMLDEFLKQCIGVDSAALMEQVMNF